MACHEEAGNCDKVVGELLRWVHDSLECLVGLGVSRVAFTDHHEPDMGLLKEVFQELGSKSRQSVPVKDGNLLDQAVEAVIQCAPKSLAVPVEATSHIGDDFVSGQVALELLHLAVEGISLMGT